MIGLNFKRARAWISISQFFFSFRMFINRQVFRLSFVIIMVNDRFFETILQVKLDYADDDSRKLRLIIFAS